MQVSVIAGEPLHEVSTILDGLRIAPVVPMHTLRCTHEGLQYALDLSFGLLNHVTTEERRAVGIVGRPPHSLQLSQSILYPLLLISILEEGIRIVLHRLLNRSGESRIVGVDRAKVLSVEGLARLQYLRCGYCLGCEVIPDEAVGRDIVLASSPDIHG